MHREVGDVDGRPHVKVSMSVLLRLFGNFHFNDDIQSNHILLSLCALFLPISPAGAAGRFRGGLS